jgi:hypothetical protein
MTRAPWIQTDVPGYSSLIIRRNFAHLALPNALIDRAHSWLHGARTRAGTSRRSSGNSQAARPSPSAISRARAMPTLRERRISLHRRRQADPIRRETVPRSICPPACSGLPALRIRARLREVPRATSAPPQRLRPVRRPANHADQKAEPPIILPLPSRSHGHERMSRSKNALLTAPEASPASKPERSEEEPNPGRTNSLQHVCSIRAE